MKLFKKDIFIALGIYLIVLFGLLYGFDYRIPRVLALLLYIVIYALVSAVLSRQNQPSDAPETAVELPTSGPIGRFGQTGLLFTFTVTGLLSVFNPFQLYQIIMQGIGNVWLQLKEPDSENREQPKPNQVTYTLPFSGEWFIYNGGIDEKTSHSWNVLTQRYAYDFVQVDAEMKRHKGKGTKLTEYYCFGQDILAIAAGEVVKVVDRVRSAPFVGYGIIDFLATSFIGNHVIIKHADGEYGVYAHLIKGTIPIRVGDRVERGQVVGQCGHSGHSSEPHLHFHLQNRENFYFAMGVPIQFSDLYVDGQFVSSAYVAAGQSVRAD